MTPRARKYAQEAAEHHGVPFHRIVGPDRTPRALLARLDCYRALHADGYTSRQIAMQFGRDGSTVRHALRGTGR